MALPNCFITWVTGFGSRLDSVVMSLNPATETKMIILFNLKRPNEPKEALDDQLKIIQDSFWHYTTHYDFETDI